jgi:hypothetical protein
MGSGTCWRDFRCQVVFWVRIVDLTFLFSKGLHHRLGILDFRRGLFGHGEAELVEPQLMKLPGFGVALHAQLAAVGGGDGPT